MTVPADPQHITAVADAIRRRLGGPDAPEQTSTSGPAHARPGNTGVWSQARRAAGRREVQIAAAAAVLAAAGGTLLRA